MTTNNKKKTLKKVKKTDAAVHPYSRRAKQMTRILHLSAQAKNKGEKSRQLQDVKVTRMLCLKDLYVKHAIITPEGGLGADIDLRNTEGIVAKIHNVIEDFIGRNQSEIGTKNSTKADLLRIQQEREMVEYSSGGIEVPSLTKQGLEALARWQSDYSSLSTIPMVRISKTEK